MSPGRLVVSRGAVPYRVSKTAASLASSRRPVKVDLLDLAERPWIASVFRLNLVEQRGEGRTRAAISDNPFPMSISIHLRQQCGQVLCQLIPFGRRKQPNRSFDLLNCAHPEPNISQE